MQVANYSEFRQNMKRYLDKVVDNHDQLIIHRSGGKSVIVMSIDDYNGMDETDYLLSTEANKASMYRMLEEEKAGNLVSKTMDELYALIPQAGKE